MLHSLIASLLILWFPMVPVEVTDLIGKASVEASQDQNVPVDLILAVIQAESTFNPYAKTTNCHGLMQINLKFWPVSLSEAHSIYGGIWHGTRILKYYLDRNKGNVIKALEGYRGDPTDKTYVGKVLAYQKKWKTNLPLTP